MTIDFCIVKAEQGCKDLRNDLGIEIQPKDLLEGMLRSKILEYTILPRNS